MIKTPRRVAVSVVLLGSLFALGLYLLWWLSPPDFITLENFQRLSATSTRAEVEAILGGPPGDYGYGQAPPLAEVPSPLLNGIYIMSQTVDPIPEFEYWRGREAAIGVAFDKNGQRHSLTFTYYVAREPTLLEQVWQGLPSRPLRNR